MPISQWTSAEFICDVYAEAIEAYKDYGIHTICMDEQTGIQALERIAPDLPGIEGQVRRLEFEYKRHGTLCLFGNFHVATGKIINPVISETRTEADFLSNLRGVVQFDPTARFRIVLDNLFTIRFLFTLTVIATGAHMPTPYLATTYGQPIPEAVRIQRADVKRKIQSLEADKPTPPAINTQREWTSKDREFKTIGELVGD